MAYAATQRYGLDPHGAADRCKECHRDPPPEGLVPPQGTRSVTPYPLRYGRERAVCERCHVEHNRQTHPVEVMPRLAIPEGWPLDPQGQLMCSTCHDPHRACSLAKAGGPSPLLRGDKTGAAFCQACHGETSRGDSRAWHRAVVETAHGGKDAVAAEPTGTLDPLSHRCLACHDGTMAKAVGMRVGEKRLGVVAERSHPVGVAYPTGTASPKRNRRETVLRDLSQVDKRVRLFGGKVGCGTCHDLYSTVPKFLALDTRGGRLCRACHTM